MSFPAIRNEDSGRDLRALFRLNDVEILGLISGPNTFYNLNLIHAAADYPAKKWPELYIRTQEARRYLRELSETFQAPESSFYVIQGDKLLASKKLMFDYAGWISPRFKLMVHQAAERGAPAMIAESQAPRAGKVERGLARLEGMLVRRSFTDVVSQYVEPKLYTDRKGKAKNKAFLVLSDEVNVAAFQRHTWDVKAALGLSMNGSIRDHADVPHVNLIKSIEGLFAVHVPLLAMQSPNGRIPIETAIRFIRDTRDFSKGLMDMAGRLSIAG